MSKIIFLDVDGTLVDYESYLPDSAVMAIRKARENGHKVYISTGRSKTEAAIQKYAKSKGDSKAEQMTVRTVFPDMIFGGELYRNDLNKVSYLLGSYQDFLDTKELFFDLENGTWGGKGEEALFGDLGVKDITKANAIEHLLKHLNADSKDTIAFGDAKIDIPMLEYCEVGVAMGSGGAEIKERADFITDDVDKDGLYKAFVKLGLI